MARSEFVLVECPRRSRRPRDRERMGRCRWTGSSPRSAKGRRPTTARISPAICCCRVWSSCTPIISRRTTCRGPRCTGIRWPPSSPTTASSRPAASPRCSIRCGSGARRAQSDVDGEPELLADAIATARAADLLRVDHFLHLRCEVPMPGVVDGDQGVDRPARRPAALAHGPHAGATTVPRRSASCETYYRGKNGGMTDAELDMLFAKRIEYQAAHAATNYRQIVDLARIHGTPLASHDDTTLDHVAEAVRDRVSIAEFPTTVEAAAGAARGGHARADGRAQSRARRLACRQRGDRGAGARRRARCAVVGLRAGEPADGGAVAAQGRPGIELAAAIRTVSKTPAEAVGLRRSRRDRGGQTRRSDPRSGRRRYPGGAQRMARGPARGMSWIATARRLLGTGARLVGPGRLVLVVGPSGAGKDTLIAHARAACRQDATVVFPRRAVTRPASAFEDNECLSEADFRQAEANGAFAFWWSAHGHMYGIPHRHRCRHRSRPNGGLQRIADGRRQRPPALRPCRRRARHRPAGNPGDAPRRARAGKRRPHCRPDEP